MSPALSDLPVRDVARALGGRGLRARAGQGKPRRLPRRRREGGRGSRTRHDQARDPGLDLAAGGPDHGRVPQAPRLAQPEGSPRPGRRRTRRTPSAHATVRPGSVTCRSVEDCTPGCFPGCPPRWRRDRTLRLLLIRPIRRRRPGGVRGVLPSPALQLRDPRRQRLHLTREQHRYPGITRRQQFVLRLNDLPQPRVHGPQRADRVIRPRRHIEHNRPQTTASTT